LETSVANDATPDRLETLNRRTPKTTTPVIIWEELNATQNRKEIFFSKARACIPGDCVRLLECCFDFRF
jgi:hypothetical protein